MGPDTGSLAPGGRSTRPDRRAGPVDTTERTDAADGHGTAERTEAADAAAGDGTAVRTEAAGPTEGVGRAAGDRWIARAAIAVGTLPVLVAGVRAAIRGWTPTGDDAYSAVRGWDVFSSNIPLLGTWSSASGFTGHQINHPGPLQFDLLAVPVRLLGHGPGTAIGMALVNAAAVGLIGWLVGRRLGGPAAALAMGCATLLTWSMGSEMLFDPWSQYAPLLPFALFLVAVWCAVAGDLVALPIMVVAGSYALQTHLSYTILVPGLTGFALVSLAASCLLRRRHDPAAWSRERGRTLRWLAITVVTWLLVTAQPLIEQLTADGEGNLAALVRSRHAEAPTPTHGASLRALGGTVALPPAWLPPSYGSPSFRLDGSGRPTWLAAAGLVALTALLVVLGWRAWRRGSPAVAAGTATAVAALVLGFVTVDRAPMRWGMAPTYLRWMWPLGMVIWLTIVVALLDEVQARRRARPLPRPGSGRRAVPRLARARLALPALPALALPGLAVTCVAAVATLPTVDNGSASPPWTVDAIHQIDDDVVDAVEDEPAVLVELGRHISVGATAPALFGSLQDAGVPFYVNTVPMIRQLGTGRAYRPGAATVRLRIRAGRSDQALPGERLIAESVGLSPGEERELARLTDQVREIVAEHGLPLVDNAGEVFAELSQPDEVDRIAALGDDPDRALSSGMVRKLWSGAPTMVARGPLLDPAVFPADLLDRWSALDERNEDQVIKVYLSPLPPLP